MKSGQSRRIGSKATGRTVRQPSFPQALKTRAILLHLLLGPMSLPVLSGLLGGNFAKTVGGVAAFALMLAAARLMKAGLGAAFDYKSRRVAQAPAPRKTAAHLCVAASVLVLALFGAGETITMSVLYGILAGVGSYLAYGSDPRSDKEVDPELAARAGIDTETVIGALNEAEGKLVAIETDGREIQSREMVERLGRIVASGRRILDQIEKDPSDIRRARRFLITYLDGTRDVVRRYRDQQDDIAHTELGANFRHVLETVERVFAEQEAVLKQNETLDLEVQIDVLRTQMEREGVT